MTSAPPPAPAGWYPHPEMADTVRYWDGGAWTEQVAPAPTSATNSQPVDPEAVPCGYCGQPRHPKSTRCPSCAGPYFWCKRDNANMPVNTTSKWVGIARGGRQDSHRCRGCGRIIAGAKW